MRKSAFRPPLRPAAAGAAAPPNQPVAPAAGKLQRQEGASSVAEAKQPGSQRQAEAPENDPGGDDPPPAPSGAARSGAAAASVGAPAGAPAMMLPPRPVSGFKPPTFAAPRPAQPGPGGGLRPPVAGRQPVGVMQPRPGMMATGAPRAGPSGAAPAAAQASNAAAGAPSQAAMEYFCVLYTKKELVGKVEGAVGGRGGVTEWWWPVGTHEQRAGRAAGLPHTLARHPHRFLVGSATAEHAHSAPAFFAGPVRLIPTSIKLQSTCASCVLQKKAAKKYADGVLAIGADRQAALHDSVSAARTGRLRPCC